MKTLYHIILAILVMSPSALASEYRWTCRSNCLYINAKNEILVSYGSIVAGSDYSVDDAFSSLQVKCARIANLKSIIDLYLAKKIYYRHWQRSSGWSHWTPCRQTGSYSYESDFQFDIIYSEPANSCIINRNIPQEDIPTYLGLDNPMG